MCAELMDDLEKMHDEDVQLGTVAIVTEVMGKDWTAVYYQCNDGRRWVQKGIFQEAIESVKHAEARAAEEEDEDAE